jgi:hypothetical protein
VGCDSDIAVAGHGLQTYSIYGRRSSVVRSWILSGISPRNRHFYYNDSLQNLLVGVRYRVLGRLVDGEFVEPNRPAAGVVMARLRGYRNELLALIPSTPVWSYQRFVDSYNGRKKEMYAKAVESLKVEPINPGDARLTAFIKREKIKSSVPRIIQPRTPRYNVEVGRYLKPSEAPLYKAIQGLFGGSPTVAKGMNAVDVADVIWNKWTRFKDPVAVGFDAIRFDLHVSRDALAVEHGFWNSYWGSPELREWLSWQLNNRVTARARDGGVKYNVDGGRMSGDMNTSSGNVFLMCGMVYSYMKHINVDLELVNNGDDCVIICERADANRVTRDIEGWFLQLGFPIEVEPIVDEFERIVFCQMHPVKTADGRYIMVRRLEAVLEKDPMSIVNANAPYLVGAWAKSVGLAGSSFSGGIPVLQSLYGALARAPVGKRKLFDVGEGLGVMSRGLLARKSEITHETRYSYYLGTGLLPYEQEQLERYFDRLEVDGKSVPLPQDSYTGLQPELSYFE